MNDMTRTTLARHIHELHARYMATPTPALEAALLLAEGSYDMMVRDDDARWERNASRSLRETAARFNRVE